MPLEQRSVSPIFVSRNTLPLDNHGNVLSLPNELEYVTNGTLANIIRQLSSLSKYGEDLLAGLLHEATITIARLTSLQGRVGRLSVKVTQLDSSVEEVSLKDIQLRKPFKSCASYDQQVVAQGTMPESIKEVYEACDGPPPLDKLNPYRDDGKDGLKFYTDPNYFFELWANQMLRETDKEKSNKKNAHKLLNKTGEPGSGNEKARQRKPRQPANTRKEFFHRVAQQEFLDDESAKSTISVSNPSNGGSIYRNSNGTVMYGNQFMKSVDRPNSLELNQYQIDGYHSHQMNHPLYSQSVGHQRNNLMPQNISNQSPNSTICYSHSGVLNDRCQYHSGNITNQMHSHISSSSRGDFTSQSYNSYVATCESDSGNVLMNDEISANQICQPQSHGTSTRRIHCGSMMNNRPSQPPPAPPSNPSSSNSSAGGTPIVHTPNRFRQQSLSRDSLPPPPPPPPPAASDSGNMVLNGPESDLPIPPPTPLTNSDHHSQTQSSIPPPPPLPPPGGLKGPSFENSYKKNIDSANSENSMMTRPDLAQEILQKQSQMQSKISTMKKVLPQHIVQQHNCRSDLLASIREGKILRKVDENKQKAIEKSRPLLDVASILARRKALEYSDSESDGAGGNSNESGSENWEVESEC